MTQIRGKEYRVNQEMFNRVTYFLPNKVYVF